MSAIYTKQRIWEAFYELTSSAAFEKITVEQIIERSRVSKATFYRHFKDKYDVLNYNSMAIAERIIGRHPCKSWYDFMLCMFIEIERESDYYRKAFKTSGQNAHSRFLYEYSYGIVKRCYMKTNKLEKLTKAEHYMIAHYCYGCVAIIADWLKDTIRPSAKEMADLCYGIMPKELQGTWIVD